MPGLADFAIPERLVLEDDSANDTYGKFIAEPFEKGFGHTLGNALRRVLLSSLDGIAITSISIDGVAHEFSTIPNVIEDVTEIVLNFKKILFLCSGDLPRRLELKVKKSGLVTAADIAIDSVTSIINPEQLICTLDKSRELRIEIELNHGRGYHAAEENKRDDQPIGVIPIDSLYSPIRQVAYSVHDCRIGQHTDYDKLELEVWTDGRIPPQDAVEQASRILADHLAVFGGVEEEEEDSTASLIQSKEDEELLHKLLQNIGEMELSVRAHNCLNNANIATLGELIQYSEAEMLKFRNFGQKSLNEIKEKIGEIELHLGMDIKEDVILAFKKELDKARAAAVTQDA